MNLNINYDDTDNKIDGYVNLSLNSKTYTQELSEIPRCSCDHIIISDGINKVNVDEVDFVLTQCLGSLAVGGKITIQTLDFKGLCVSYLSGNLDSGLVTKIISETSSIIELDNIVELLSKYNVMMEAQVAHSMGVLIHGVKNAVS